MIAVQDPRRTSLRGSVITFVMISGGVVLFAVAALLVLDPRTQAFWAARWNDLALTVRGLFGAR